VLRRTGSYSVAAREPKRAVGYWQILLQKSVASFFGQ
jgi:hypothetical protein